MSRERGSITVFFVLFALVMTAAVSYSLYVGRVVDEKIRVDQAADVAALAMASHAAAGLNMIAANNLATGANLHIAAAVSYIGRYYAVAKALTVGIEDIDKVMALYGPEPDKTEFAKGFQLTSALNGHFTRTAAGITTINRTLAKYWLYAAPVKGLEQARLNAPGSVMLPLQVSRLDAQSVEALYAFRYERLAQATPEATMCHALKSSEPMGPTRDGFVNWIGGAIESMTGPNGIVGTARGAEATVLAIRAAVFKPVDDRYEEARNACSVTNPFTCIVKQVLGRVRDGLDLIPIPTLRGCKIELSGDLPKQLQSFAASEKDQAAIGFIVPHVDADSLAAHEGSLQFAAVVGQPHYLSEELPTPCPSEWQTKVDGREVCGIVLDGLDFGVQGGHRAPTKRPIWSRVQWAVGQAKAEYEPDAEQDDPTAADARPVDPADRETVAARRSMQLFWPAWRSRNAEPTALAKALSLLAKRDNQP